MTDYIVVPLNDGIEQFGKDLIVEAFKKFSCSDDTDLENFLLDRAIKYEESNKGKTFLFLDKYRLEINQELIIMAYYTLAITAINLSNFPDKKKKRIVGDFPNRTKRDSFPAFLIGQLGRCDKYSHTDLSGETMLNEAYCSLAKASTILGGKLVILECREHMYDKVYCKHGFLKLSDDLNGESLYMLYKRVDFASYLS